MQERPPRPPTQRHRRVMRRQRPAAARDRYGENVMRLLIPCGFARDAPAEAASVAATVASVAATVAGHQLYQIL